MIFPLLLKYSILLLKLPLSPEYDILDVAYIFLMAVAMAMERFLCQTHPEQVTLYTCKPSTCSACNDRSVIGWYLPIQKYDPSQCNNQTCIANHHSCSSACVSGWRLSNVEEFRSSPYWTTRVSHCHVTTTRRNVHCPCLVMSLCSSSRLLPNFIQPTPNWYSAAEFWPRQSLLRQ